MISLQCSCGNQLNFEESASDEEPKDIVGFEFGIDDKSRLLITCGNCDQTVVIWPDGEDDEN